MVQEGLIDRGGDAHLGGGGVAGEDHRDVLAGHRAISPALAPGLAAQGLLEVVGGAGNVGGGGGGVLDRLQQLSESMKDGFLVDFVLVKEVLGRGDDISIEPAVTLCDVPPEIRHVEVLSGFEYLLVLKENGQLVDILLQSLVLALQLPSCFHLPI